MTDPVHVRRSARTRVGRWQRATAAAVLTVLVAAGVASATSVTVGYRDFTYSGALASRATAESTQSKLWFADGSWWGGLFRSSGMGSGGSRYEIFKLDDGTQTWLPTGRVVDSRDRTHADYLWDGTHNKLYVASSKTTCTSNPAPPSPPGNTADPQNASRERGSSCEAFQADHFPTPVQAPLFALASTASQTCCVSKASRKVGPAGLPVESPSRKSAT
jgi:hypothetical protein